MILPTRNHLYLIQNNLEVLILPCVTSAQLPKLIIAEYK